MEEFQRRKEERRSAVDFGDVFGGPPRTLFLWQAGQSQPQKRLLFYDEIFRIGEDDSSVDHRIRADPNALPPSRSRNLPAFMIPADCRRESERGNQGFYDDVFSQEARSPSATDSGSRSRSTSAGTSPHRLSIHDDVALSAVASMLK